MSLQPSFVYYFCHGLMTFSITLKAISAKLLE
jgi:hypothetical protein